MVNTDTETVCRHWFIVETSTSTSCCPAAEEALKRGAFLAREFFPENVHAKLCNAESFSIVNNVSVELVQYRRCSQWTWSRTKEVVVGDLLVLYKKVAWTCYRAENGSEVDPTWFCIQAFELQVRRKKKKRNTECVFTEDVGQNRGTTLDHGEDTERGMGSTL